MINKVIDFFVHPSRYHDPKSIKQARLVVRGSLLTSLFSSNYLFLSIYFEYEKGFNLMLTNVIGFLLLPFLLRTKLPVVLIGNLYVLIGGYAVTALAYFSGGIESALYPWIISIPILALLIVNRKSAYVWGAISFFVMILMGVATINGYQFPVEYNTDLRAEWFTTILPGLLLIILFITMVFEHSQSRTLAQLEDQNNVLYEQKEIIEAQKEELTSLIEDKDYIIRILAHDLRSPLNNIKGLLKLMDLETEETGKAECKALIMQTTVNAENLVNRVLEMDKSEQDDTIVHVNNLNVVELLLQLSQKMQELANKKSIQLKTINKADRYLVKADKTYLLLIFENLLSNAIKFSDRDKTVTILLSNNDESIIVEVIDEGPGISPEEEDKLFKKFSKLSARPTAGESSTGLGLSLVKRYVELVEGNVWYKRGEKAKGANFVVELPLVS
ncbi:hypothetical protein GCM10011506_46700 [Marivirga lumbricoides]|uniref:histidine kinase n=1 Tax=Marivirga lumbricoides TaxID=1046115 RepID=A0ABQ1NAY3_9BACT|nr:hypothetical protein GCM10011506_46700 [Marivirga lumbricoides]